jgi:RHS repeat-associated protein
VATAPADYYPLQDLLYRTTALADAAGNVAEAYDTDAYGRTLIFNATGTDATWFTDDDTTTDEPTCEFIFTGRRYDPETQLYFYRARYYNQALGRFISRDPNGTRNAPIVPPVGHTGQDVGRDSFVNNPLFLQQDERKFSLYSKTLSRQYSDGMNLYQYVRSNPPARTDWSGLLSSCYCGPDITDAVANLLKDIDRQFSSLSSSEQDDLCDGYIGVASWDTDLYTRHTSFKIANCPQGKACLRDRRKAGVTGGSSVTFNGKCFASFDANYLLYGAMMNNCGIWNQFKANAAFILYKSRHSSQRYWQARAWASYGSTRDISWLDSPPKNLKVCQACPKKWKAPIGYFVNGNNGVRIGR